MAWWFAATLAWTPVAGVRLRRLLRVDDNVKRLTRGILAIRCGDRPVSAEIRSAAGGLAGGGRGHHAGSLCPDVSARWAGRAAEGLPVRDGTQSCTQRPSTPTGRSHGTGGGYRRNGGLLR